MWIGAIRCGVEMTVTVGSVTNAIAILRHLAGTSPQGVNAIARALSLSPSSCFNILKTLVAEDFIDFDDLRKTYTLGAAPGRLFADAGANGDWIEWLLGHLESLASRHSLCCGLWRVRGNRVVLSEVIDSPLSTRIHLSKGQRLPIYLGAMGRAVIALEGLSREQVQSIIGEMRWENPPKPAEYWRDIQRTKSEAWSLDDGNYMKGIASVAAVIVNARHRPAYCITAHAFAGQLDRIAIETVGVSLASLAREASERWGWVGDDLNTAFGE